MIFLPDSVCCVSFPTYLGLLFFPTKSLKLVKVNTFFKNKKQQHQHMHQQIQHVSGRSAAWCWEEVGAVGPRYWCWGRPAVVFWVLSLFFLFGSYRVSFCCWLFGWFLFGHFWILDDIGHFLNRFDQVRQKSCDFGGPVVWKVHSSTGHLGWQPTTHSRECGHETAGSEKKWCLQSWRTLRMGW